MITLRAAQVKKRVSFCEKLLDYEPSESGDSRGEKGLMGQWWRCITSRGHKNEADESRCREDPIFTSHC